MKSFILLAAGASAHSNLIYPKPRNAIDSLLPEWSGGNAPYKWQPHGDSPCACTNGTEPCESAQTCLWFSVGCSIGCKECDGGGAGGAHPNMIDRCGSGKQATITTRRSARSTATPRRAPPPTGRASTRGARPAAPVYDACGRASGGPHVTGGTANSRIPPSQRSATSARSCRCCRRAPCGRWDRSWRRSGRSAPATAAATSTASRRSPRISARRPSETPMPLPATRSCDGQRLDDDPRLRLRLGGDAARRLDVADESVPGWGSSRRRAPIAAIGSAASVGSTAVLRHYLPTNNSTASCPSASARASGSRACHLRLPEGPRRRSRRVRPVLPLGLRGRRRRCGRAAPISRSSREGARSL